MNNLIRALQREEKKSVKLIAEAQRKLDTVRKAMQVLGGKAAGNVKRRSAAARKKMSLAAKKRWAKIRAGRKSGS